MCDGVGTNKKALRELKEKFGDIHIVKYLIFIQVWCISHTLSNAGKQLYNKDVTPWIDSFINTRKKVIQYIGNARNISKTEFGASV